MTNIDTIRRHAYALAQIENTIDLLVAALCSLSTVVEHEATMRRGAYGLAMLADVTTLWDDLALAVSPPKEAA